MKEELIYERHDPEEMTIEELNTHYILYLRFPEIFYCLFNVSIKLCPYLFCYIHAYFSRSIRNTKLHLC